MCSSDLGEFNWNGNVIKLSDGKIGELSLKLYETLTGIQNGLVKDELGWMVEVK